VSKLTLLRKLNKLYNPKESNRGKMESGNPARTTTKKICGKKVRRVRAYVSTSYVGKIESRKKSPTKRIRRKEIVFVIRTEKSHEPKLGREKGTVTHILEWL